MRQILETAFKGEGRVLLVAREHGIPVAGVCIIHGHETAYYVLGGYREGAHHGAGALAVHCAIVEAHALGLEIFDFEGSSVPSVEKFFRGFGGVLSPSFSVHRAALPIEIALKARFRNRF